MDDTPARPGSATSTPPAAGLKGYAHAALYMFVFILFVGWGAGPIGLDAWRSRR